MRKIMLAVLLLAGCAGQQQHTSSTGSWEPMAPGAEEYCRMQEQMALSASYNPRDMFPIEQIIMGRNVRENCFAMKRAEWRQELLRQGAEARAKWDAKAEADKAALAAKPPVKKPKAK